MGSGDWFRSLICMSGAKEDRSKKVKVHSSSKGAEGSGDGEANGSAEQKAAIRIQTAFRRYLAKKSVRRRFKGAVRFNVLIQSSDTQKQASSTLSHIHSWSYIQSQIMARRHHMVTEGRIMQKKLQNQLKLEAKLQEIEGDWNGSSDTMEEIMCRMQQREEAAVKRERAMAYAFSHQWKANPTQYLGQAYYSIGKENWGWSWKERWVAARPWEIRVHTKQPNMKATTLLIKHASSNGKNSAKTKKLSDPTIDL
ncbi:protein IQ-DOMAIN 10-like isoform X2 [Mercurialis annua]|uniref:protein IQ-DOMAIN 10-like isoform X2 n=1 Tax=Mercurialis annua TaxID=3986 RepID=UPI00215EDA7E|nr:protein IQ-DOMAIN 10-like isoform X2 [Mercurialis annua]